MAREFQKQEVDRLVIMDINKPTQTKGTSLIMFVSKKDGTPQSAIKYLKFNKVTIQNS